MTSPYGIGSVFGSDGVYGIFDASSGEIRKIGRKPTLPGVLFGVAYTTTTTGTAPIKFKPGPEMFLVNP